MTEILVLSLAALFTSLLTFSIADQEQLGKEALVATGIVITCLVDFTRLRAYMTRFSKPGLQEQIARLLGATLSAYIGNVLLKKVALKVVLNIAIVMFLLHSTTLGLGIV